MAALGDRIHFLFRSEEGTIDAATWRRHAGWLALLVAVLTLVWMALRPNARHDLATTAFIAPMTILTFAYLIVYAFTVLLAAISYTMLTMKRLRARGEPTGLAGLVPLLALFSGAMHFLQAKTPEVISYGYVVTLDVLLVGAILWTIFDLGFRRA